MPSNPYWHLCYVELKRPDLYGPALWAVSALEGEKLPPQGVTAGLGFLREHPYEASLLATVWRDEIDRRGRLLTQVAAAAASG